MITRRTAKCVGEVYELMFALTSYKGTKVYHDKLYDFLYENEYSAWFCNMSKTLRQQRSIQEWIMKLHTGETQAEATPSWSWSARETLGQEYLRDLAKDILNEWHSGNPKYMHPGDRDYHAESIDILLRNLQLDGYSYEQPSLLLPETDVLDVKEAEGVLQALYRHLQLDNESTATHHLSLSESHYIAHGWDDSIGNSRKYLECVLCEVASRHSQMINGTTLLDTTRNSPVQVRDYLQKAGLLESKEKEALAKVYGLLSHQGAHPYMAESEQARLLRHLALTFSHFVMLRLDGCVAGKSSNQTLQTDAGAKRD